MFDDNNRDSQSSENTENKSENTGYGQYYYTTPQDPQKPGKMEKKKGSPHINGWAAAFIAVSAVLVLLVACAALVFTVLDVEITRDSSGVNISIGGSQLSGTDNKATPTKAVASKLEIVDVPKTKTPTPVPGQELTTAEIAKKVKPAVVGIVSESLKAMGNSSTGSGIIMSADGYIITNHHVVNKADQITVVLDNGTQYVAELIGSDEITDLAVLKINAKNLTAAVFGNSDSIETGDRAVAIGNPYGLELQGTVTQGIISAINRNIVVDEQLGTTMTLIQTDAAINFGNSGGPLVNKFGQVIGINSLMVGETAEGLGFAIPINSAKEIIDELIQYGKIRGRPYIGITGTFIDETTAGYNRVPVGIYVESVTNADAAKKGLAQGDIIIKISNVDITSMAVFTKEKEKFKAGDKITLTVYRMRTRTSEAKTFTITVTLMEAD